MGIDDVVDTWAMSELVLPRSTTGEHARRGRLLSDELLAKLVGRGSSQAFGVLYERHHQALYRYCRSILRNEHDAQDALQSTMTQAYAALRARERDVSLRAWLFRIAHNESITILRKSARERDLHELDAPSGEEPGAVLESRERLSQLVADVLELPERQRAALLMRELSGLRIEEIAAALAISPATAKQALFEARNSLREFSEGREMGCEQVRLAISAHDRRVLRGRRIRGHLKGCESCRDFQAAIGTREADLRTLTPLLPAPAATAILTRLLGGHWSGTAGGGVTGAVGGSAPTLLAHAGSSLLLKAAAGAAIMTIATAGTVHFTAANSGRNTAPLTRAASGAARGSATGSNTTETNRTTSTTGAAQRLPASNLKHSAGGSAATLAGNPGGHESHKKSTHAEERSHVHGSQHPEKTAQGKAGKSAHSNKSGSHGATPKGKSHGTRPEHGKAGNPAIEPSAGEGAHGSDRGKGTASTEEQTAPAPASSAKDATQSEKPSAKPSERLHKNSGD